MKKKLLSLFAVAFLSFALAACATPKDGGDTDEPDQGDVVTNTYTVIFEVNGTRYQTERVKEGEKITSTVNNPVAPDGQRFVGWFVGDTQIDLETYVVTGNVTIVAKFEAVETTVTLSVDDVKEDGKTYYLVLGWWECTDVNSDGTPKLTSNLTKTDVRLIYSNIINYLKLSGVSETDINNIQFRNYSSLNVTAMGEAINADADVDIMFGVGINITTTAAVALYNSSNDYKFQTPMGATSTARYVACTSYASEVGVALFDWLKETDAGKAALLRELTDEEIQASLVAETINLTVTVHGETDKVTVLQDKDTVIDVSTVVVPENSHFVGFALTADGEVVLDVTLETSLKYADVKDLVATNASTLDLYPIFAVNQVATEDLVVYIQVNGNNLFEAEAKLLEARFNASLSEEKNIKFNIVDGNASAFTAAIQSDADVIIGGNSPVNGFGKHADGPTANAGAKHFANSSRKVIISDTCSTAHLDLAKELYNFVKADAPVFDVYSAVWTKGGDWVTTDELTAIEASVTATLNSYLKVTGENTLESVYNVTTTYQEVTTDNNKVADLGAATRALRDGLGADLIIGCGNNVDSTAGMTIVAKQTVHTSIIAANRYVALIHENVLTRLVYDTCFTVETPAE